METRLEKNHPLEPPPPLETMQRPGLPPAAQRWLHAVSTEMAKQQCGVGLAETLALTDVKTTRVFLEEQLLRCASYRRILELFKQCDQQLTQTPGAVMDTDVFLLSTRLCLTPRTAHALTMGMRNSMANFLKQLVDVVQRVAINDLAEARPNHVADAERMVEMLPQAFLQRREVSSHLDDIHGFVYSAIVAPALIAEREYLHQAYGRIDNLSQLYHDYELSCHVHASGSVRSLRAIRRWHKRLHRSRGAATLCAWLPSAMGRQRVELQACGMLDCAGNALLEACRLSAEEISDEALRALELHLKFTHSRASRLLRNELGRMADVLCKPDQHVSWCGVTTLTGCDVPSAPLLQAPSHMGRFCDAADGLSTSHRVRIFGARTLPSFQMANVPLMQGVLVVRAVTVFLELVRRQHLRRGWNGSDFMLRIVRHDAEKYDEAIQAIVEEVLEPAAADAGVPFCLESLL